MQHSPNDSAGHYVNHDEISLTDLAKSLYTVRWFILLFAAVTVIIALGVARLTQQYKSTSFWYFEGLVKQADDNSGISLSDYSRIMDAAKKRSRFENYLESMQIKERPEADLLRKLFNSREGIARQIKPFSSSLTNSKQVNGAPVLGVSLEITAKSKELAHDALVLLSNYLADTLAYDFYYDSLLQNQEKYRIRGAEIENQLLALKIKRPQLEQQQALVEGLIEKYAKFFEASRSAQTLIATEDNLNSSPMGKLMSLQLEMAALDDQVEQLVREQKQIDILFEFYQSALALYKSTGSSEHFFSQLPSLLSSLFKEQNLQDEVIKEVYNRLTVEASEAKNFYKISNRQLVKPNLPQVPTTRFALVAAAALLGGLMLASILVLLRSWWREVSAPSSSI